VARSGLHGSERPEPFFIDKAEQEDADEVVTGHVETMSLELMLKDNVPVNAPLDYIKAQKIMEVVKMSKAMTEIHT
jgi:hypothetical protein